MPNYRQVANGFVADGLSDGQLAEIFRNLSLLRQDTFNNFDLMLSPHVAIETLSAAKALIGGDFKGFLEANYNGGSGRAANLFKDISHYINGVISHQCLMTSINVEERKLKANNRSATPSAGLPRNPPGHLSLLDDNQGITNFDLYRLMAGIAPANVGRIFQLLGGESYYA